ncbi:hypothetical protein LEN26_001213 [Aphanomyces euteiches]|nr:hypothetical protein LEN26_001213 [Aphanomyces euteiches]
MDRAVCFFEGCNELVAPNSWRCSFHRGRDRCSVSNCRRQAYAKKLCARHGGKRKCSVDGCLFRVRSMGLCARHGVKRKPWLCRHPDCSKPAQALGLCIRHGGGRRCKLDGCETFARRGGYCCRHNRILTSTSATEIKSEVEEQVADIVKTEPTVQVVETKRVPPPPPPVKQDSDPFVRGILDLIIEM